MQTELLPLIESYLARSGFSASYFGFLAANNKRLVPNLRAGRPILTTTDQRVREYIASNPTSRSQRSSGRKGSAS